jgi:hypothetical protein
VHGSLCYYSLNPILREGHIVSTFYFSFHSSLDFFFFFICPHKEKGRGIRTSNLYFIMNGLQSIELHVYSHVDWIGDPTYHWFTTGYCFLLGEFPTSHGVARNSLLLPNLILKLSTMP